MARTITNFLIGISAETSGISKGIRDTERNLESLKSTTNTLSAGMVAAFVGVGHKVDDIAEKAYELNNSVYRLSTNTQYVQKLGGAFQALGGDASDALRTMQQWDGVLDDLRVKGQSPLLTELKPTGMDVVNLSQSQNSEDFNNRFADQFAHLDDQQKRVVAGIVGLSDAQFRLYSGGTKALQDQMNKAGDVLHITQQLTDQQTRYTQEVIKSDQAMDGLWNTVSGKLLPAMTELRGWQAEATQQVDEFIQNNPEQAAKAVEAGATVAGGAALGTAGVLASKVGIPGAKAAGRLAGPIGFAIGTGQLAEEFIAKPLENKYPALVDNPVVHAIQWAQDVATPSEPLFDVPKWARHTFLGEPEQTTSPATGYRPSLMYNPQDYHAEPSKDKQQWLNPEAYHPSMYNNVRDADYERQADATARAVRQVPLKVENHVEAKLYMDSREIDSRVEKYNERENFKTTEDLRNGFDR